jgi:hypothetical protein
MIIIWLTARQVIDRYLGLASQMAGCAYALASLQYLVGS